MKITLPVNCIHCHYNHTSLISEWKQEASIPLSISLANSNIRLMEYVHMYFTELIDAQLTISNNQTNFLFYFIDNSQEQQKFCSYFNHTLDYLKNQTLLGNEVSEESLEKYWKAIVLADKLQAALPMKFTSSQKTKV